MRFTKTAIEIDEYVTIEYWELIGLVKALALGIGIGAIFALIAIKFPLPY